ncbi:keratin-associated protein 10-6 isoform X1 [Brienomyrus brachyistius]|uniref:keratin-associated protein 10-6 isoform X1 n=1 Tax=Brienomyrus brachyistius TaxID=42636 RepID=UPI0020B37917|nr:keratin-associated protein 10-6 isoform X1 [Brienomyrus brachyistius]XP_048880741.1 keratin-associated protein 10-6 isoform X1 [Brienomyrus brachyistius]
MPSTGCVTGIVLILIVQLRMTTSQSSTIVPTSSPNSDITTFTSPPPFSSTENTTAITNMTTLAPSSTFTGSTNATATTTGKSNNNSTGKQISCRTFTCNSSMCYATYLNTTASPCTTDALFCELRRLDSVMYSANCSAFCNATVNRCANSTMTSCSVDCCNSTDCLNSTLASLMITATVTPVTTVTTQTISYTLVTTMKNGKKCHKLNCQGEKCYQTDPGKQVTDCLVGQDFCKLNKTNSGTTVSWEAACSGNCTGDKSCGSTAANCTQECCTAATSGSCLKLDGSVNMPNSAVVLHVALSLFFPWLLIWALGFCFLIG